MPQPSKEEHDHHEARAREASADTEQPEPPHAAGSTATPALLEWLEDRLRSTKVCTI
jgi:hypothetical protein